MQNARYVPLLQKHLPSDPALCRLVIKAIVLVHNFRTYYVGYSQIQTVFLPEYVWLKTFKVTTKLLSITSIQGTTTARLMGMGVAVMAKAMRIRVYCMTN